MHRLLILLILSGSLFAQQGEGKLNQVDENGLKQGTWIKYFPGSDIKRYEGQFIDDIPVGIFRYYYPEGQLRSELKYRAEKRSSARMFYTDGTLMATGVYSDTLRDSTWTFYNIYGGKLAIEAYIMGLRY